MKFRKSQLNVIFPVIEIKSDVGVSFVYYKDTLKAFDDF